MSAVRIASLRTATPAEWDAAWEGCETATFFHSSEWAGVWHSWTAGKYVPAPRRVEFEDGTRAVIAASVRKGRVGFASLSELSPASTFGGWVSTDALGPAHAAELARAILALSPRVRWRLNPYDSLSASITAPVLLDDTTQVVELSSDFDAVFHQWDQGQRQKVAQARRAGLEVRLAADAADWKAYFDAYQDSLRRWGARTTSAYPWRLFETLCALASPRIRLWVAALDGRVIAGVLCLYARRHVAYWHGAAVEEHMKKRPMNLLLHAAMEDACARGFRWFDFNPSGGHESVRAFKEGFGVVTKSAPVVGRDTALARIVSRLLKGRAR